MMVLAMPHVDLAGVVITPADCFLGPATSSSLKVFRFFDRLDIEVSQGTLHWVNPFPRIWRSHIYPIDALPILNENETALPSPVAVPGHEFIARKLREASEPFTV